MLWWPASPASATGARSHRVLLAALWPTAPASKPSRWDALTYEGRESFELLAARRIRFEAHLSTPFSAGSMRSADRASRAPLEGCARHDCVVLSRRDWVRRALVAVRYLGLALLAVGASLFGYRELGTCR